MSSLLAKRLGARKVIALINRQAYGELMQGSHIDIAVSPSHATMSELLRRAARRRGRGAPAAPGRGRGAGGHRPRRPLQFKVVGRPVGQISLPRAPASARWCAATRSSCPTRTP